MKKLLLIFFIGFIGLVLPMISLSLITWIFQIKTLNMDTSMVILLLVLSLVSCVVAIIMTDELMKR